MAVPLHDLKALRALESHGKAQLPAGTLMERAGSGAAAIAWRSYLSGRVTPSATVFAGPGDNGGDAFICALHLASRGVRVHVFASDTSKSADAQAARARCAAQMAVLPLEAAQSKPIADCVVDGLLGIGIDSAPRGDIARAIRLINKLADSGVPVLSLDVPSGLNAVTGVPPDPMLTVRASCTITFISAKAGLYTASGPDFCGLVLLDALGLSSETSDTNLLEAQDFCAALPHRVPSQHKGASGDLLVVGGAAGMAGAALLAGRAALATGIGRLYIGLGDSRLAIDPVCPEAMLRGWDLLPLNVDAIVAGCGMTQSDAARATLARLLAVRCALVLDADALNLVAHDSRLQSLISTRPEATVLTPHPLEAARLLSQDVEEVQSDRLSTARALANKYRSHIVLKGAGSVIASPDGKCFVNLTGNAALATGGTGDMLAGCLGALLAEGAPPLASCLAATYAHGRAAENVAAQLGGTGGLTSMQFLAELSRVVNRLRAGSE
jgi:ADP-dependent NAD(P)H-hydrate dehydratase / NAD(P)H-hydrate epimerase